MALPQDLAKVTACAKDAQARTAAADKARVSGVKS
jgi:hypothetical protein